jgi:hypothetical protein
MCSPIFAAALCAVFPLAPAPADSPAVAPAPKAEPQAASARSLPMARVAPAAYVTVQTVRTVRRETARSDDRTETEAKGNDGASAEATQPTETEGK